MKGIVSTYTKLNLLITGICICATAFAWILLLQNLKHRRQQAVAAAVQRNDNLAVVLEQYTMRTLALADAQLQVAQMALLQHPGSQPVEASDELMTGLLKGITIADESGRIVFSGAGASKTNTIGNSTYFRYHANHPEHNLHITQTSYSPVTGKPAITLSRRIDKSGNAFGGIVLVQIPPTEFTRMYAAANLRAQELISLIDLSGLTYARRNGSKESWGEDISHSKLLGEVARKAAGNYYAVDVLHHIATYFSYRKVAGYPVIVTAGTAEADVLAAFYQYRRTTLWSGGLLTVLMLVCMAAVIALLSMRNRGEMALKESEARYRAFFEHSMDAILVTKPTGEIMRANPAACKIFRMTEEELCNSGRKALTDNTDPMLLQLLAERREKGKAQGEITFVRKDGTRFPGEVASTIFTNSLGEEFSSMIIRDTTERKHMQQRLLQQQQISQRRITEQVIHAQEKEREEIGRELHDNVNQVLTSAKLYLDLAITDPQTASGFIGRSNSLIMSCINEIRNLSRSLAAATLGTDSLADALNALAEIVQSSSGMAVQYKQSFDEEALSKEQKLALYRIVQEQLNNIVKHAKATRAYVGLVQRTGHLELTIRDNGKGFDASAQTKGIGLSNIVNRAKVLDGEVTINTAPNAGCTLLVSLPLLVS